MNDPEIDIQLHKEQQQQQQQEQLENVIEETSQRSCIRDYSKSSELKTQTSKPIEALSTFNSEEDKTKPDGESPSNTIPDYPSDHATMSSSKRTSGLQERLLHSENSYPIEQQQCATTVSNPSGYQPITQQQNETMLSTVQSEPQQLEAGAPFTPQMTEEREIASLIEQKAQKGPTSQAQSHFEQEAKRHKVVISQN